MTIRATIVMLALPLFLGLALVNGALLYFQDQAEVRRALNEQALVTAVIVAEFTRASDTLARRWTQADRTGAIQAALGHIEGLDNLYLIEPGREALPLKAGDRPWDPAALQAPERAYSFAAGSGRRGDRWVVALAPAGADRFVAARYSADPIYDHMAGVRREIFSILLVLAVLAAGLALFVARRVTRELDANRHALGQRSVGESTPDNGDYRIRETQDLADAVRLMDASQRAAQAHRQRILSHKDRQRDPREAILRTQSSLFAPCTVRSGNCEIAMRLCGDVPEGSFFAHALTGDGGVLVIGCCRGRRAVDTLAAAREIRRLIERCDNADAVDRMLSRLRTIHEFDALQSAHWKHGETGEPLLLAIAEEPERKRALAWCQANDGIAPGSILANLEVMLAPQGLFALVGPVRSGEGSERGVDVGFDSEDGAEAADVEDLSHRGGKA